MKKGLFIIIVLTFFVGNSQNYGYLIETGFPEYITHLDAELVIKSDVERIGGTHFYSDVQHVGNTYYSFFSILDNFSTIIIDINNGENIDSSNLEECRNIDSITFTKDNFNLSGYYFSYLYDGDDNNGTECIFKQKLYPLHLEEPNEYSSSICLTDRIYLGTGYSWEYSLNGTNWVDFPVAINSPETNSIYLSDLSDLDLSYTGSIKFRTSYNNNYVNTVSYNVISCSPQLLDFDPKETTCSYKNDGTFSMILDRDLIDKRLFVTLYKENEFVPDDFSMLIGQETTTELTNNGDGNYSYLWPEQINTGTYKVKYQSRSITVFNVPEESWDSLELSQEFDIGSPDPVTFSVPTINNVNCFNGNDGAFIINATGGVGNFEYELNNSSTWIPFSSSNTHNIIGLPASSNTIKVRDANGCTEQE